MAEITAIRAPRRGSKLRIILLDGEPWREASSEVIAKIGIAEGDVLDEDALAEALKGAEPACARDRAIRLLSYRDHSSASMTERLQGDGFSADTARDTVRDLERLGFIDDSRLAAVLARSLVQIRRFGSTRALMEMRRAGIPDELATDAIGELSDPEEEHRVALELARVGAAKSGATVQKVTARLVRRGYSPAVAMRAARAAFSEVEHDPYDDLSPDEA